MQIPLINEHLFCEYFVRQSVGHATKGRNEKYRIMIFSAPNWDIAPIFFVQIPLINEHLFCKYFVRLSVGNATKGRNVKILET